MKRNEVPKKFIGRRVTVEQAAAIDGYLKAGRNLSTPQAAPSPATDQCHGKHAWYERLPGVYNCRLCGVERRMAGPQPECGTAQEWNEIQASATHAALLDADCACMQMEGEKKSTATPLIVVDGAASDPLSREYFKQELERCREQLVLERKRADELQGALDEERAENGRLALQMEQLQAMSGSERASAYIARLQAQITALGGKKNEFDQE